MIKSQYFSFMYRMKVKWWYGIALQVLVVLSARGQTDEFIGPFNSWTNLKVKYGAKGDGITDDTKAIQLALDELDQYNNPVLFIPAGKYIISQTLVLRSRISVTITGEDPLSTIVRWNGSENGTMLQVDGAGFCSYSRLTWDGAKKANTAMLFEFDIQHTKRFSNTASSVSDMIYTDLCFGIRTGGMYPNGKYGQDAECMVSRCRFYNCSVAGIAIADWNDLDWYIWSSWFENCALGVTNDALEGGAGNFHVYQSFFSGSTEADIKIGVVNPFSLSWNRSINSKKFLQISRGWNTNGALVTIQGNTIMDTQDSFSVRMVTKGNILFIDNIITNKHFPNKASVLYASDAEKNLPDMVSIGNTFGSPAYFKTISRKIQADDRRIEKKKNIENISFKPVPFLLRQERTIFEIPKEANAAEIQRILDKAYSLKGKKPVVHFAFCEYKIDRTIKIREGADMQLIGDGAFSSQLTWVGEEGGLMLEIGKKSQIQLCNLYLRGNKKANLIVIKDDDMPGNYFYAERLMSNSSLEAGLDIRGFSKTAFDLLTLYQYENKKAGVIVTGTKGSKNSSVNIYGYCGSDNHPSFQVNDRGRLLVREAWYEGSSSAQFARIAGNGNFCLNSAQVAVGKHQNQETVFELADFKGKILISQTVLRVSNVKFKIAENISGGKFLMLGCLNHTVDSSYVVFNSSNAGIGFANSRFMRNGSEPALNRGNTSIAFIKELIAPVRNNKPVPIAPVPGRSLIKLYNINLGEGITNLKLIRDISK